MSSFSTSATGAVDPASVRWERNGITYKLLPRDFDQAALFAFNKEHGTSPLNFIPDEPVKAHFAQLATGKTKVWGAFDGDKLVGFISGEDGGGYWLQTGDKKDSACFINEFVVDPSYRGKRIGVNLTSMSVDAKAGVFAIDDHITEMYTTVHVDNVTSRTAFIKGGYTETITYADAKRDRDTTVLKFSSAKNPEIFPRGNAQTMRVVGVQSGNAVDGIDVGIFDFEPAVRSAKDPRALAKSVEYSVIANKTFSFTPEERQYVLGLRAMRLEDGNEYAEGNYKFGDWIADRVNRLIDESGVDKSSIALIGSHGQTVSGHPHWEFGDLSVIAQKTGITVAGDFRPADVAAGGNGTPCTCTYDTIMLRPEAGSPKWRIAINIGGTSSVTFCPPWPQAGEEDTAVPLGLDPGLGVFFMDLTVRAIDPSLEFDDNGNLARSGTVNEELLATFLENKYYKKVLPIGVGPDDFPETLWQEWRALAQSKGVSDIDLLATFTELTAKQIAQACSKWGGPNIVNGATDDVLLRGGVVNNGYFVERLKANFEKELKTPIEKITTLDSLNIDEDAWENAMYALFGYLCYNNLYNFVPSCTGAVRPVVGGRIAPGENFHSVRLLNTPM
jgi:anhydro-N-acetylmuramic acid kinase